MIETASRPVALKSGASRSWACACGWARDYYCAAEFEMWFAGSSKFGRVRV